MSHPNILFIMSDQLIAALTGAYGRSLLPVIEGGGQDRLVFAQAHEAVGMLCLMARQGRYKYNYIHGYGAQLFDLEADPGEWNNLAGEPAHAGVEAALRARILAQFDPDAIAQANLESLHRRWLIRETMQRHEHTWCHFPQFDARRNALMQHLP